MRGNFLAVEGEEALEEALHEYHAGRLDRIAFLSSLMNSRVYVFVAGPMPDDGASRGDAKITVLSWILDNKQTAIPFFSSLSAMKQCQNGRPNFVPMSMAVLLKHAAHHELLLNPGAAQSEQFSARAMIQEVCPTMTDPQVMMMPGSEEVCFIEPAIHFSNTVPQALNVFCREHKNIVRAYVNRVEQSSTPGKANFHIAFVMQSDIEQTLVDARRAIVDRALGQNGLQFAAVTDDGGAFAEYLAHAEPFYRRLERAAKREVPPPQLNWWQKVLKASLH